MDGEPTDAATIAELTRKLDEATTTTSGLRAEVEKLARQVEANRQWRLIVVIVVGLLLIVAVGIGYATTSIAHENLILEREKTGVGLDRQIVTQLCQARDDIATAAHQANPAAPISLPATPVCAAFTP